VERGKEKNMKILQLNTERTYRGGEKQTYYTIIGLLNAEVEVGLVCRKGYPLSKKVKPLLKEYSSKFKVWEVSGFKEEFLTIARIGKNYDLIHAQTGKTHTTAILTKPFHRKRVLYTRRVHFVPSGFLTKLKYKLTDEIVAISQDIKNILCSAGIRCDKVVYSCVYPKEINFKRGEELKRNLGIYNKKIIGTFSAFVPHKDPFTLIKVIEELKRFRKDFVFLHFGEGELREEIEKELLNRNLEDVYKIMGFWEDVEDFFSIFDVFVISSSGEGLGSSILDAFYYEVPVVATSAGGLKEIVNGRGILCPVGDSKSIAKGINKLLENTKLRQKLTKSAKKFVEEECSIEVHTRKYLKIYEEVLKG